ncbi:MAG TPA: acetate/propionate family kinase [bacterium]|nr:acetate/propionate family kinase [bacterium]
MLLIINAGSQTTKFALFDAKLNFISNGKTFRKDKKYHFKLRIRNEEGREGTSEKEITKKQFLNPTKLIRNNIEGKVDKIGFRIVHGGEEFREPTELTKEVVQKLEALNDLAPLHNPPALNRAKQFRKEFINTPLFGIFDTAFHQTIPEKAFLYGLPYDFYKQHAVRRYGFHGTSVRYVLDELNHIDSGHSKVIVCHLGGGSSITAIKDNKSVDTSMGFTPLEGLIMSTRSGDVDNAVIYYLVEKQGFSLEELQKIENKKSGVRGISGETADMRKLLELEKNDNKRAKLAIDMYVYRIQKMIGSYIAALNGIDALVFTAGIGEGSDIIRKRICEKLKYAGIEIDDGINGGRIDVSDNLKISTEKSKATWVIPTNEELQIAREINTL